MWKRPTGSRRRGRCAFPLPPIYRADIKRIAKKKFKGDQKYLSCMKAKPPKKTKLQTSERSSDKAETRRQAAAATTRAAQAKARLKIKCRRAFAARVKEDERWEKKRL